MKDYILKYKRFKRADPEYRKRDTEISIESIKRKRLNVPCASSIDCKPTHFDGVPSTSSAQLPSNDPPDWGNVRRADSLEHRCMCCDRLWFDKSTIFVDLEWIRSRLPETYERVFSDVVTDRARFCKTCYSHMGRGKIPPLAASYGFRYPELPKCLADLTETEERLVALRDPYVQTEQLVLDVPVEMEQTAMCVPRSPKESEKESIDPDRVLAAAEYLLQTPLYQSRGIQLNSKWNLRDETSSFRDNQSICDTKDERVSSLLSLHKIGEELSFPRIYCGHVRRFTRQNPPTHSEICNSELRRYDRRGATPQKILFNYTKQLHLQLDSCISIALRKKVVTKETLTVEHLQTTECIDNLPYRDAASTFTKTIAGSPSYWSEQSQRLSAQIRQFGCPVLSLKVTADECESYDLAKQVVCLHEGRSLTEAEFESASASDRLEWVDRDPAVCVLYFRHKIDRLFSILKQDGLSSYKMTHYYRRIEFEPRTSCCVLLYLNEAPVYDGENEDKVIAFVDRIATCSKHHPQAHLLQKGDGPYFFPMDRTRVLVPLEGGDPRTDRKGHARIVTLLSKLAQDRGLSLSFEQFLDTLGFSLDAYLYAVRSGIECITPMLRRDPDEICIRPYNDRVLTLMQSHTELEFLSDATAVRLVKDVGRSSSKLLAKMRKCIAAIEKEKAPLREKLRRVGDTFLNGRRVDPREAAWYLLQLPSTEFSENDLFVSTFPPEKRCRMVKSRKRLRGLDKSSADVFEKNLLDMYAERPKRLEGLCLIDFAAWYNCGGTGETDLRSTTGRFFCQRRSGPRVVRYCNYKRCLEETNFYREQVMLYVPWRDEKAELIDPACKKTLYESNLEEIKKNRKRYVLNETVADVDSTVRMEKADPFSGKTLDYDVNEIYDDGGLHKKNKKTDLFFFDSKVWSEEEYLGRRAQANEEQRVILDEFERRVQSKSKEPFRWVVQGAAGTGKSFLIQLLEQCAYRNLTPHDPLHPVVVKMAPTGKAASNISGMTIHAALGFRTRCDSKIYADHYKNCQLVIVDEMSMVGHNLLYYVCRRLKELKGSDDPFGGLHIILFGDMRQLPPVLDTPLYLEAKKSQHRDVLNLFEFRELTENMRQREDAHYAKLLIDFAKGNLTGEQLDFLKDKQTTLENVPRSAHVLFYSNEDVDRVNNKRLEQYEGESIVCAAHDSVFGKGSDEAKSQLLNECLQSSRLKTHNLSSEIPLKTGVRYMLTTNVDTQDRLVNGAIGVLRKIETCPIQGSDELGVKRVWFEFAEGPRVGETLRNQCGQYAARNTISPDWTPVVRFETKVISEKGLFVIRNQLPLAMAEAMTIHKSQGSTLEECAVGYTRNMSRSLQYVALSRVKNSKHLFILYQVSVQKKLKRNDAVSEMLKFVKT